MNVCYLQRVLSCNVSYLQHVLFCNVCDLQHVLSAMCVILTGAWFAEMKAQRATAFSGTFLLMSGRHTSQIFLIWCIPDT
jgi:hypothetical protein